MKKFFFMAVLSANLQGMPQVQFNTVTAIDTQNITASTLGRIQNAAAEMVTAQEVAFDDIVIHNLFFLGEMTEEEFKAGIKVEETLQEVPEAEALLVEQPTVNEPVTVEDEAALIGTSNDLSELDAQNVEATPVDNVTTADVKSED